MRSAINVLWVIAIACAVGFGWTNALLGIVGVVLVECAIELKMIRGAVQGGEQARAPITGGGASGGASFMAAMRES